MLHRCFRWSGRFEPVSGSSRFAVAKITHGASSEPRMPRHHWQSKRSRCYKETTGSVGAQAQTCPTVVGWLFGCFVAAPNKLSPGQRRSRAVRSALPGGVHTSLGGITDPVGVCILYVHGAVIRDGASPSALSAGPDVESVGAQGSSRLPREDPSIALCSFGVSVCAGVIRARPSQGVRHHGSRPTGSSWNAPALSRSILPARWAVTSPDWWCLEPPPAVTPDPVPGQHG